MIKQSLAGFKQKLSSATEKKLEEKIQKIEKLESELFDIHKKINTYTQILRSDKNSRFHRKDVRIEDIEDLINQYTESTKKQTRHIATVTTAFGKIKMLLESQDGETVQRENYYNL
jgi:septal ring factor EnvC (AmiA/AmiB activator)